MSAIIPFDGSAKLPAYLQHVKDADFAKVNADVLSSGPTFPFLSLKGKTFSVVKNGERVMLKQKTADGDEVPRQSIRLVAIRANTNARTYYSGPYQPDDSEGKRPDCYSNDGVAPAADSPAPQSKKCALCPHAAKGSKVSNDGVVRKGSACARNTRLAVMDPEVPDTRLLMRVPPASRWEFGEAVKQLQNRNIPYNAVVLHVSFDPEETLKVLFKSIGFLSDELYAQVQALYDSDEVKEIVGLVAPRVEDDEPPPPAALPGPVTAKEVEKAVEKTVEKVKTETKVTASETKKAAAKAEAAPKSAPAPKPAEAGDNSALLAELDSILGLSDD